MDIDIDIALKCFTVDPISTMMFICVTSAGRPTSRNRLPLVPCSHCAAFFRLFSLTLACRSCEKMSTCLVTCREC